jgi:hypothetical protein
MTSGPTATTAPNVSSDAFWPHRRFYRKVRFLRIQQDGSEFVRLSVDGGFVVVGVPVVMSTDAVQRGAVLRYSIGTFLGRETPLPTRHARANLSLRIPKELFSPRRAVEGGGGVEGWKKPREHYLGQNLRSRLARDRPPP